MKTPYWLPVVWLTTGMFMFLYVFAFIVLDIFSAGPKDPLAYISFVLAFFALGISFVQAYFSYGDGEAQSKQITELNHKVVSLTEELSELRKQLLG